MTMEDIETAQLIDGLREEIRRLRAVVDAAKAYHDHPCEKCFNKLGERLDKGA